MEDGWRTERNKVLGALLFGRATHDAARGCGAGVYHLVKIGMVRPALKRAPRKLHASAAAVRALVPFSSHAI